MQPEPPPSSAAVTIVESWAFEEPEFLKIHLDLSQCVKSATDWLRASLGIAPNTPQKRPAPLVPSRRFRGQLKDQEETS